jgi:hypothetical protein
VIPWRSQQFQGRRGVHNNQSTAWGALSLEFRRDSLMRQRAGRRGHNNQQEAGRQQATKSSILLRVIQ